MRKICLMLVVLILVALMAAPVFAGGAQEGGEASKTVAVVTPYMANATTAYVIEEFKKNASAEGVEGQCLRYRR